MLLKYYPSKWHQKPIKILNQSTEKSYFYNCIICKVNQILHQYTTRVHLHYVIIFPSIQYMLVVHMVYYISPFAQWYRFPSGSDMSSISTNALTRSILFLTVSDNWNVLFSKSLASFFQNSGIFIGSWPFMLVSANKMFTSVAPGRNAKTQLGQYEIADVFSMLMSDC